MTAAGIVQAHVCGPLGQALAVIDGETWLYEVAGDRRRPSHNDIRFFFDHGLEVRPITGSGANRVDIAALPSILDQETRNFRALHGLLFGMDPELDDATRTRSMRRAEALLAEPTVADFVSQRFLHPPDAGAWDVARALELSQNAELPVVARLYAVINGPLLRRIEDTVREWATAEGFDGVRRADLAARTYDNGLVAAATVAAHDNDRARLGALLFRADAAQWDRRLVAHLVRSLMRTDVPRSKSDATDDDIASDITTPETSARARIQAMLDAYHVRVRRLGRRQRGLELGRRRAEDPLEAVQRQLDWIAARFLIDHPGEAWNAVVDLARQQLTMGEPAYLAKSLTNLASRLSPCLQPALLLCDLAALCAPEDPATRTAGAEVFRKAGRLEDALAAYQQAVHDFPQDAYARNGLAETLRELGRLDEALAAYQQAAREFPQNAVARNGLAETLRKLGRLDEALAAYQQTAREFPQDAVARNGLAETLRELGRLDEALAAYQQTAREFPQDAYARNGLAETLRELGRLDEALAAYQQTAREFPQDAYARNGLAETLRELGRLDEALAAYQQAAREFPQNAVARNGLAETLRKLGRLDEALAAYQQTAREFPQDAVARNGLAETLRELGRLDEALAAYQQTAREFPQDAYARNGLAETLRELGRLDEALAAYQQTACEFPQDAVARTGLAETLRELGRLDEALAAYQQTAREFPQDAYARNGLAETLRELGRLDEALAAYQQTAREFPQDAYARNGLAETLRELGRLDEALAAYQQTAREFPQDAYARNGLAETLRELGRLDEALAAYQQTAREFPQDAVARNGLAETLRELGRLDEALAAYQQTVREFPQNAVARTGRATLLVELGQTEAAETLLRSINQPPVTHADWVATHILCMIELRAGTGPGLVSDLERFVQTCPFRKQQRYFRTSLAVARLALKQAGPARASLSDLVTEPGLNGIELAAINLMKAHAEALDGDLLAASRSLDTASNVFPYEEFRVRRMRQAMQRRFGLGGMPRLTVPAQIATADRTLALLEMDFVANRASRSGPLRQKAA